MGHIILFTDYWLKGDHKHVVADEPNLAAPEDSSFNDRTRSFTILSGTWELYRDINYQNPFPRIYGPGVYELADAAGVAIDTLSSLRVTTQAATVHGDTPPGQVTLFENAGFRGGHRHRFTSTPSLTDAALPPFNDVASSLVIRRFGVAKPWVHLCSDVDYGRPYAHLLGTGAYGFVGDYGLPNDDLSSFSMNSGPGEPAGLVHGDESFGEIILFEHENFRGRHRHVYLAEPDLGTADGPPFARMASSMYIERGAWALCREPNYQQIMPAWNLSGFGQSPAGVGFNWSQLQAPKLFLPGAYPSLRAVGVDNDALTSLHLPLPDLYWWNVAQFQNSNGAWVDSLWLIIVTGPHAPGGVTLATSEFDTSDQLAANSIQPPLHEIGSYTDASGFSWAHVYCVNWDFSAGTETDVRVSCTTEGAYGVTEKTNAANWPTSAAPAPPATVAVPAVVGDILFDAAQKVFAVGLRYNTIMPPGIVDTHMVTVTSQSPAGGTQVAPGSNVDLAVVATQPAPAGYSLVHVYNSNTDGTAYEIWTWNANTWKDQGSAAAGSSPFDVTLPDGPVELFAMAGGAKPQSAAPRANWAVRGDSNGPAVNWNIQ